MNEKNKKIIAPRLGKRDARTYDYRELNFKDFILIQRLAQEVANNMGFPVYLVGSAQYKHLPRDIDISIIIPHDEYVKRYYIPSEKLLAARMMELAFHKEFDNIVALNRLVFDGYELDLKICSDAWWKRKPKTLLAKPRSENNYE